MPVRATSYTAKRAADSPLPAFPALSVVLFIQRSNDTGLTSFANDQLLFFDDLTFEVEHCTDRPDRPGANEPS
jgi:hypothetical protein